jgi:hypothetical protein
MNQSVYRKMAYMAAFVALLFPMAWLGAPSTRDDPEGGKLDQIRKEAGLGQAEIGDIDPASETIRMATLGLRGMAVTMLWTKANELKKTEDWNSFQSTLEQLAKLQPYFVKVWEYQAWNLSYNVSVELDDVRDRFYYVKQGIKYLKGGIRYLRDNPTLLDDLGWFCGNKVGRADEHEMYRDLFKKDDELHDADVEPAKRDNWLVSKEWYVKAIRSIDDKKHPLGTKNPVTFFDSPARSQMSYAEAIEEEGNFESTWKTAWEEGARLWREYANRDMRSTDGFLIRLGDLDKVVDEGKELSEKLDALSPGLAEKMKREAEEELTPEEREILIEMPASPTPEDYELQAKATEALVITPEEIADRIARDEPERAREVRTLAKLIADNAARERAINTNRDVANFEFWRLKCEIEQTPEALQARSLAHQAEDAFNKADPEAAQKLYERSFDAWAQAMSQFPGLGPDSTMGSDLMDFVDEYAKVLEGLDLSLADPEIGDRFPLWDVVEANDSQREYAEAIAARRERQTGVPEGTEPAINPADLLIE